MQYFTQERLNFGKTLPLGGVRNNENSRAQAAAARIRNEKFELE